MQKLSNKDTDFALRFERLVNARREADRDVTGAVTSILSSVKTGGDKALLEFTQRFDGYALVDDSDWVVTPERCAESY